MGAGSHPDPVGAHQAQSHTCGVPWGSVLPWLGAGWLSPTAVRRCHGFWGSALQQLDAGGPKPSPTPVRLCCGALAQPQQVLGRDMAHPGILWPFQPLVCSNCSLKMIYIFSWATSLPGAMTCVGGTPDPLRGGLAPSGPQPPGAPPSGRAGEGALTVPLSATGGQLHTGAGTATPGTTVPLHLVLVSHAEATQHRYQFT